MQNIFKVISLVLICFGITKEIYGGESYDEEDIFSITPQKERYIHTGFPLKSLGEKRKKEICKNKHNQENIPPNRISKDSEKKPIKLFLLPLKKSKSKEIDAHGPGKERTLTLKQSEITKKRKPDTLLTSPEKRRKIEETFKLPLDNIASCRGVGMSHIQIIEASCLTLTMMQEGYYIPTDEQLVAIQQLGAKPSEVVNRCLTFKEEYPLPIRNPALLRNDILLSEAIRVVGINRNQLTILTKQGIVIIPRPKDFLQEEPVETPEERRQRKAQQKLDFQQLEARRGVLPKSLQATIKVEYMIWEKHFSYIKKRKGQCIQKFNPAKKISRSEIEDSFYRFVASQLQHITVEGYTVYFSLKTLDIERENHKGDTNLDRMKLGFCPIGADGEFMNFHHLTHHDYATHNCKSIIVLLTEELHTKCSGLLHFGKNTYQSLPHQKVFRSSFDPYRKLFNQKIAELLES